MLVLNIKRKINKIAINNSSFQQYKHFKITRKVTNEMNGNNVHTLMFFVDVAILHH
jgi:hypothetical protein